MKIDVISANGDPKSPKTWSGTPKNVSAELIEANVFGEAYEGGNNNAFFKVTKFVLRVYYYFFSRKSNLDILSKKWLRRLYSVSSIKYFRNSSPDFLLHFGTLSVPLRNIPGQKHIVLTDGTWNLWEKNSTDMSMVTDKQKKSIDALERKCYENLHHIFSISKYVKEDLIFSYGVPENKISVVGTGTGIIKPFFGEKDYSTIKILFVAKGRFEDKGGNLVLETFKILSERFPNISLTIVGQKDYSQIEKHKNIETYGFVSLEKLQEIFDTHSLFLMPALNEPWGLVYVEALLCKMPIIGLNRNSFPELSDYGNYGFGINEPDPTQLADLMGNLIKDTNKIALMGQKGQKAALEKFTWKHSVKLMIEELSKHTS